MVAVMLRDHLDAAFVSSYLSEASLSSCLIRTIASARRRIGSASARFFGNLILWALAIWCMVTLSVPALGEEKPIFCKRDLPVVSNSAILGCSSQSCFGSSDVNRSKVFSVPAERCEHPDLCLRC